MAVGVILKEAVKWVALTFGKDVLFAMKDALEHQWRRVFATRNILILGPKQSGKSSLLQYLTSGRPYEIVDGEIRAPAPTALAAIVDRKFALDKGNWLRLKRDVPGDLDLRDAWAQAITDLQPHGVVYMIDGRRSDADLRADVRDIRDAVLAHCATSAGHLATLHVFVNFADHWAASVTERRRRLRLVREELDEVTAGSHTWAALRLGASATQLDPNKKSWEDAERALHHFGADLTG